MILKAEAAAQIEMRGLDSMKSQLLAKATEVGARATPGMANPSLKLSIRKAIIQRRAREPTDYMGFGKRGALTHRQVLSQHPTCATWCQAEVNAGGSWELARFAPWPNEVVRTRQEMTRDPGEVSKETMGATMEDELEGQEKLGAAAPEEKNTDQLTAADADRAEPAQPATGEDRGAAKLNELHRRELRSSEFQSERPGRGLNYTKELDPISCVGSQSASRRPAMLSAWNGRKLGAPAGNQKAREARDDAEPDHLWVSVRRGALSNLALCFNGKAEAAGKRMPQAIKEYKAAVQLVHDQATQGKHARWEWPIKCEGWGHAMIRHMVEDCSTTVVEVAGRQLGAKNDKGQPLLQELLIATTSPKMAARMSPECLGDRRRGELAGGGPAAAASNYSNEFAKRTVRAMIEEAPPPPDNREFLRCLAEPEAPEGQALAAGRGKTPTGAGHNSKEHQQIMRWLTSVHRGSGHSSKTAMLNALRRKGASPLALQVARDFHCDARAEAKQRRPAHPPVSLEVIPPTWKRFQADQFEWGHPRQKTKLTFPLTIDEICTARVSKLLCHMLGEDRHRRPVWADLESFYEERWVPYFGKPQKIKVGPEAIQATKGTMDRPVAESPEMSTEEALARAVAAGRQVYTRRISRAENTKNQTLKSAAPGMRARYFRAQKGETKGRFKGLARAPAAETPRPVDGDLGQNESLRPGCLGPVVWLVRAGRIIEVDLSQARAGSAREIARAELMGAARQEHLDFTGRDPAEHDAEFATREGAPDPAPPLKRARATEPAENEGPKEPPRGRPAPPGRMQFKKGQHLGGTAGWARTSRAAVAEKNLEEQAALMAKATPDARAFWARQGAPLELPFAGEAPKQATRHMSTSMASQLGKGKREISERTLTPDELKRRRGREILRGPDGLWLVFGVRGGPFASEYSGAEGVRFEDGQHWLFGDSGRFPGELDQLTVRRSLAALRGKACRGILAHRAATCIELLKAINCTRSGCVLGFAFEYGMSKLRAGLNERKVAQLAMELAVGRARSKRLRIRTCKLKTKLHQSSRAIQSALAHGSDQATLGNQGAADAESDPDFEVLTWACLYPAPMTPAVAPILRLCSHCWDKGCRDSALARCSSFDAFLAAHAPEFQAMAPPKSKQHDVAEDGTQPPFEPDALEMFPSGETQCEGPPDSLTDSTVPEDYANTIPAEVLQRRRSLEPARPEKMVNIPSPTPGTAGSASSGQAAPPPVARFADVAKKLSEAPTPQYSFKKELAAAAARTKITAEELIMTAAPRWDRWEDVPVGIQQGFIDKLGSRFPVKLGELPVESTNYKVFFEGAPQHVVDKMNQDFELDRPAWQERIRPWIDPAKIARDSAREVTKRFFTVTETKSKETQKGIDDGIIVVRTEFMAFEGFWHRKTDEESTLEFERIHAEQNGKYDVTWAEDGEVKVLQKIATKDIGRIRTSKGESKSNCSMQVEMETSAFDAEVKRRRLMAKSSVSASSCDGRMPPSHVPTNARSAEHYLTFGDSRSRADSVDTLDASTVGVATSPREALREAEATDTSKDGAKLKKGAPSETGGKTKLFKPKSDINIDDAPRERVAPTMEDIEKMEPVVFMEVKRHWSEMASHVHAGFMATGSGYVSQLRAASDAVGNEAHNDLDMPTDELIKSISSIAQEIQIDEIEKTKRQVHTQLDGLRYLNEKGGHDKHIEYMSHYNKRIKIMRRLMKCNFSKELADNISRAICSMRGDAEKKSLVSEPCAKGGKLRKPLLFQGSVALNGSSVDPFEITAWSDPNSEVHNAVSRMIQANSEAIDIKIKVHDSSFDTKGQNWLGCLGRVKSDWVVTDVETLGDGYFELCTGGVPPWLMTIKADCPRWGPAPVPLVGFERIVIARAKDAHIMCREAATVLQNGASLKVFLKFAETEEGSSGIQGSTIIRLTIGEILHAPTGAMIMPLHRPLELQQAVSQNVARAISNYNAEYLAAQAAGSSMYKEKAAALGRGAVTWPGECPDTTEVNNYVITSALETLPPGAAPPPEEVTRTRHLVLQMMARLGFAGYRADVTGAFTQNREIQHNLFAMPVKELAAAAIEWFATVSEAFEEFGWTQTKMDPRVWVLRGDARGRDNSFTKEALQGFTDLDIVAIAGSRVGDFLLGCKGSDPRWAMAREQIQGRFKW
ncbi:unnamed protein product [Prorocentrum cordatum]|uniref:Uncharacterized protein n=1 Tax=Prorocentrum cordatum TaxID=2364126 RepID=A0ABN9SL96_9DINO|nr:unnamed protein product [Polarella glacialis]